VTLGFVSAATAASKDFSLLLYSLDFSLRCCRHNSFLGGRLSFLGSTFPCRHGHGRPSLLRIDAPPLSNLILLLEAAKYR
jgi:hypothetical protein